MKRNHTPLSLWLGVASVASIVMLIVLPHFLPAQLASMLNGLGFIVPVGLIFWSLKSMKPADQSRFAELPKAAAIMRYAAAYTRMVAGLLIVIALVAFSKGWEMANPHTVYGTAFLISIFVVSVAALVLTVLNLRPKSGRV